MCRAGLTKPFISAITLALAGSAASAGTQSSTDAASASSAKIDIARYLYVWRFEFDEAVETTSGDIVTAQKCKDDILPRLPDGSSNRYTMKAIESGEMSMIILLARAISSCTLQRGIGKGRLLVGVLAEPTDNPELH